MTDLKADLIARLREFLDELGHLHIEPKASTHLVGFAVQDFPFVAFPPLLIDSTQRDRLRDALRAEILKLDGLIDAKAIRAELDRLVGGPVPEVLLSEPAP